MKKALLKDTFREVRKSFGRFISIFGIVLVGVAFFTGVKASAPYMKNSADAYFDRSNFCDYRILSPIGFESSDVDKVSKTEGVSEATGGYSVQVLSSIDTSERVFQMMSYDEDNSMNSLTLVEGRMPENSGECVLRYYTMKSFDISLGDEITFTSGTDIDISNILANATYKVVGFVTTPYYLSYQYDSASIGSGKTECVGFLPESEFVTGRYSVIYAACEGAAELNCYDDEYFDLTDKTKEKLETLSDTWYVLDRNSHFSYVDYGNCADRMDAIARVFPVFFYLVAALVCLTTMTRMVDEQRGVIGTLKALGYSKFSIAMKYVTYALTASAAGGIAGCVVGLNTFPKVIFNAWNIVYTVDGLVPDSQLLMCVIAVAAAVAVTVLATVAACIGELVETPALLLRPKSPKNGRKVFLERIPFMWKRFSFSQKVTARNILRYKKRFFMTVIGIAGCTALILAGFGIKNSVSTVVSGQYGTIFGYDVAGVYGGSMDEDSEAGFIKAYRDNEQVNSIYSITQQSATASDTAGTAGAHEKTVTMISVDDSEKYSEYTTLQRHSDDKELLIPKEGALITYKLAKDYGVKAGDYIYVKLSGDEYYKIYVADVVTMYVGQYVFMNDEYYAQVFGEQAQNNSFIAILNTQE